MTAKRRIPAKTRVRSALRRLWMISPERSDCLRAWGYKCADCGAKQSVAKGRECKLDVHHLDGIDWGEVKGNDVTQLFPDPSRLVPLCKACHKARHAKEGGMNYYRTTHGFIRIYNTGHIPANDETPVVVIDKEKWDRLVELHASLLCDCHQERTPCEVCEIDEIIQEVSHDAE